VGTLTLTLIILFDNSQRVKFSQQAPLPQTFNTSGVSVWFEAECVSLLATIGSDLDMTLV
jgi:hypothetical protein